MKKLIDWIRFIGGILIIITLGWLAYLFKLNIGSLINSITGTKKTMKKAVLNTDGEQVGVSVPLVISHNILKDKYTAELADGTTLQLPKGVTASDVKQVTKVNSETYKVVLRHESLTSLFDD